MEPTESCDALQDCLLGQRNDFVKRCKAPIQEDEIIIAILKVDPRDLKNPIAQFVSIYCEDKLSTKKQPLQELLR